MARLSEGRVELGTAAGGDLPNGDRRRPAAEHPRSPVAWPSCLRGRSSGAELLWGCDCTNGGRRRRALKNYRRRPAEHPRSPVAWPGCLRGRSNDAEQLGGRLHERWPPASCAEAASAAETSAIAGGLARLFEGRVEGAEPLGGRFTEQRPPAPGHGTSAIAGGLARLSEGRVELRASGRGAIYRT
jgi:hypothetical protein